MITGGCQCGAVRYRVSRLGRSSICHCRMCQKAFGSYFAPLVEAESLEWTRGERAVFASSNLSSRGFCARCGTPLTLETGDQIELAVGTLDDPSLAEPTYQANPADRATVFAKLSTLPEASPEQREENEEWNATIVSHQHPDHDTENWAVKR